MRHLSDKIHLGRTREHRYAMLSNMTASLVMYKKIITTLAKAKYARRFAERMITFARKGDLSSRRHVASMVRDKVAVQTLFDKLGEHFKHRNGGYTRIIRLGPRHGDAAPMALLELVGFEDVPAVTEVETTKTTTSRLKAGSKSAVKSSTPKIEKSAKKVATPKVKQKKLLKPVEAPSTKLDQTNKDEKE